MTVRDDTGATIATDTITLAPNGHTQFTLVSDKYSATANIRGTIEFDRPLALRSARWGFESHGCRAHIYDAAGTGEIGASRGARKAADHPIRYLASSGPEVPF